MNQQTLDMVVHAYCDGCQEFIGDYEVGVFPSTKPNLIIIEVSHKDIKKIDLPWEHVNLGLDPKAQAEIVIELVKQIFENGHKWLKDEESYHGDKLAEKWDNDYKSEREND